MTGNDSEQIEATSADFKALANPTRLRLLRLCLYEALTNKQLADRLDLEPPTSWHHVRMLVRAGFLEAEAARTGDSGALEKPYRATSKSWRLAIPDPDDELSAIVASVDALRAELLESGPNAHLAGARVGLQLSTEEVAELTERIETLVEDYRNRPSTPDGQRVGLFLTVHRLKEADRS